MVTIPSATSIDVPSILFFHRRLPVASSYASMVPSLISQSMRRRSYCFIDPIDLPSFQVATTTIPLTTAITPGMLAVGSSRTVLPVRVSRTCILPFLPAK